MILAPAVLHISIFKYRRGINSTIIIRKACPGARGAVTSELNPFCGCSLGNECAFACAVAYGQACAGSKINHYTRLNGKSRRSCAGAADRH